MQCNALLPTESRKLADGSTYLNRWLEGLGGNGGPHLPKNEPDGGLLMDLSVRRFVH